MGVCARSMAGLCMLPFTVIKTRYEVRDMSLTLVSNLRHQGEDSFMNPMMSRVVSKQFLSAGCYMFHITYYVVMFEQLFNGNIYDYLIVYDMNYEDR